MGHGDYAIHEFATRLATIEEKFSHELRSTIECFYQSRLDLPAKKLDDIGKARARAAKHLRKIDKKKSDEINLWKICNIYSSCAVDTDNGMRDVRKSLRKILVKIEKEQEKEFNVKVNGNMVTPMRRLGDDYRPIAPARPSKMSKKESKRSQSANAAHIPIISNAYVSSATMMISQPPTEIYDANKPSEKEKLRYLANWYKSVENVDHGNEQSTANTTKMSLKDKFRSSLDLLRSPQSQDNSQQRPKQDPTVKHSKSLVQMAPCERRLQKDDETRKSKREKFLEKRPSLKAIAAPTTQIRVGPQIFKPNSLPPKPMLRAKYIEEGGTITIELNEQSDGEAKKSKESIHQSMVKDLNNNEPKQTVLQSCGRLIEDEDMLIMKL